MMMMLMFFHQGLELVLADGLIRRMDLRFRPTEDFLGLDPVDGIFYEFPVLHHPLDIIGYPGLFFGADGHAHIAEQLLFRKGLYIVGAYFDAVVMDHFIDDERPFELVHKGGEFLFHFGLALWLFATGLHPAFQKIFGEFDLCLVEQHMVERML